MTKQYKAVQAVGRFAKGDFIEDLPEAQINQLLADGVIKEHQPEPTKTQDKSVKADTKAEGAGK